MIFNVINCFPPPGPFLLLSNVSNEIATPQAPVYATIRPASSQIRPTSSPDQCSLNSLPTTLNPSSFKSPTISVEPFQFHPTNPFYTTLPSNYSSASKLPVPNGKASLSSLDRSKPINKPKEYSVPSENHSSFRSPSYFTSLSDSGPHSTIFSNCLETGNTNGYDSETFNSLQNNEGPKPLVRDTNLKAHEIKSNEQNPFKTKRNSDPFDKFLRKNGNFDDNIKNDNTTIPISISDSDIHKNQQETTHITVTEREINETEEIKTTKKVILNGSSKNTPYNKEESKSKTSSNNGSSDHKVSQDSASARERYIKVNYSPPKKSDSENSTTHSINHVSNNTRNFESNVFCNDHRSLRENRNDFFTPGKFYFIHL